MSVFFTGPGAFRRVRHLSALALLIFPTSGTSQNVEDPVYTLKVAVDEVNLTFHVADFQGTAMNDLRLEDLRLRDNGKAARQVVSFHQRSQYRLDYKPVALKKDGSFHHIQLVSPTRGGVFSVRSGYYAPR